MNYATTGKPAHVEIWNGGGVITAHRGSVRPVLRSHDGKGPSKHGGGVRGVIDGLSYASRRRLMRLTQRLERTAVPIFVTLTYPAEWPGPEGYKRDKAAFFARLERRFPEASFIWKLEFQKRGAPHLHLLVFGVPYMPLRCFVPVAWFEVVGSRDVKHLKAGTQVEVPRLSKAIKHYVGKYVWKSGDSVESAERYGRFWGARRPELLPWAEGRSTLTASRVANRFMRYMKRYARLSKRWASAPSLTVLCECPERWAVLLDFELGVDVDVGNVHDGLRLVDERARRAAS